MKRGTIWRQKAAGWDRQGQAQALVRQIGSAGQQRAPAALGCVTERKCFAAVGRLSVCFVSGEGCSRISDKDDYAYQWP